MSPPLTAYAESDTSRREHNKELIEPSKDAWIL